MNKDNKNSNENKNVNHYINELNEINKLKEQVNDLTNVVNSLQDDLATSLSKLIDEKLSEIITERKNTNNQDKFDSKLGERIRDTKNEELNVRLTRGNKILTSEEIDELNSNYQPDMVVQTQDRKISSFIKQMKTDDIARKKIHESEPICSKISETNNKLDELSLGIYPPPFEKITKEYLENNPVKNYDEFIYRLHQILPNTPRIGILKILEALSFRYDDINSFNKFIIHLYEESNKKDTNYSNYKCKNLLGEYIKNRGITQVWLSERTGIAKSTIANIISNEESMPTVDKAIKIAKVLDVDIETIFPLEEFKNQK
jgi:Predicted transcriptional regulators